MHILRWLMKHPIMLAWLLAIVAILLNFSMVGNKTEGQEGHGQAQEASAEHGQPTADAAHGESAAQADAAAAAPAQAAVGTEQAAPAANANGEQAAAPAAPAKPVAPEAPVAPVAPAAPAAPASAAAPAQSGEADLLRAAREAYWSNELENAVGFYTSLLEQNPDSIEYKGELANVYWKQGNAQEAAKLFAEIAPKLAAQGRVTEAFNMKLYVDMVDPELAKQIDAALK